MQPYVFPYIGYFQLIQSVDHFVFYDDVTYIKGGWINRNKLLVNNEEYMFTIPLSKASSSKLINDIELHPQLIKKWKKKFLKTLHQSYKNSPYFNEIYSIVDSLFREEHKISELAINSVVEICKYLNIEKKFYISSIDFPETKDLNRSDRLINITKQLESGSYINMPGGKELYEKKYFLENDIKLEFLESSITQYAQDEVNFVSGLSIIDVLMFNDKEDVRKMMKNFRLE